MRFLSYWNLMVPWMRILLVGYRLTERIVFYFVYYDLFSRLLSFMSAYLLLGTGLKLLGVEYFALGSTFTGLLLTCFCLPMFWLKIVSYFFSGVRGQSPNFQQRKGLFWLLRLFLNVVTIACVLMVATLFPLWVILRLFPRDKRSWIDSQE